MPDQRNLILAIALSVLIFLGFQLYMDLIVAPVQQTERQTSREIASAVEAPAAPSGEVPAEAEELAETRAGAIAMRPRIDIASPRLRGTLALQGARFDDLTLTDYRQAIEPDSANITLLSPVGTPIMSSGQTGSMFIPEGELTSQGPYFADFGWQDSDGAGIAVPGSDTVWRADARQLTSERPVTLTWDNGADLRFVRSVAVDDDYMLTMTRRVENRGTAPVSLSAYGRIKRTGTPPVSQFWILHEGAVGVFDGTLSEDGYDDIVEAGEGATCEQGQARGIEKSSTGGWVGITDKYWLVALAPEQNKAFKSRFSHCVGGGEDKYQVDFQYDALTIPAGGDVEVTDRLYVGAKEVKLLEAYKDELGIAGFDRAAAFPWWIFFIAKPLFEALIFFNNLIGNFGVAILMVTVIIKLVFFPLANKSYRSMAAMKKLQPEIVKLKERYGGEKLKIQQETMALYKAEGANPMMGCLPMLIQIPVFFALYVVLFVSIEMRHAPFFGWVADLSARDPSNIFNPFGVVTLFEYPDFLHIGLWPLLMGFSMWLQFRLNPQPTESIQRTIFTIMPIFFTFILAPFPAGLVVYWTWNNLLSIAQQWIIMRRHGIANPAAK